MLRFAFCIACCVATSTLQNAKADITWGGAGETGLDPLGNRWLTQPSGFQGIASWGIPGRSLGTDIFNGDVSITRFEVEFFGLPDGVEIWADGGQTFEPTMSVTPFLELWDMETVANQVIFTAKDSSQILDPGDQFIYYVVFTNAIDLDTFRFEATYSTIPEPSVQCLILVAVGGHLIVGWRNR